MKLSTTDLNDLRYAKLLLENPGLAARITNSFGKPLEKGFDLLPESWAGLIKSNTRKALQAAIHSAVFTLGDTANQRSSDRLHTLMVAGSGAAGGFWGLPGIIMELPISTTLMIRSIADIARSEGHSVKDANVKISCLQVFALGGPGTDDDAAETGYFAVRAALAKTVSEAAQYLARKGVIDKSAPVLVRMVTLIAARFGIMVSEKVVAQTIPVVGAAGGALVNILFMDHFQRMARGHFIVLRLEKSYGELEIRQAYSDL